MGSLLEKITSSQIQCDGPAESMPRHGQQPCACGGLRFWFDLAGGGPHCHTCRPAVKVLLARNRELVAKDGVWIWRDELPTELRPEVDLDEEFDRSYRSYTSRTGRWFIIERRDWSYINSAMIMDD